MPRDDLRLRVNGLDFGGWKTATVTRAVECVAGGFDLSVSDRWSGRDQPWPIAEEDECELILNGETVITGYVDRRTISYSESARDLRVSGRDRSAALVDCSVFLRQWEYLNVGILTLAHKLCEPFGITVTMQTPLRVPPPLAKVAINPGETAWSVLEEACRKAGVLAISDGKGGVVLTRAGTRRATTALVRGENILEGSGEYDAAGRYRRYVVMGQKPGTDQDYGPGASAVRGEAKDTTVRRSERVLVVHAEGSVTPAYARARAEWEATVRAARARVVTYTVQGWTQADGSLWPLNALVAVRDPWLEIQGDLLIVSAQHTLGEDGTRTRLSLVRDAAFTPEPVVKPAGAWKELA